MRIFGFAGWSGSGKTTLIEQLIPRLVGRGLAVSLVKHAHHRFQFDQSGKDSFRHIQAGCSEVLLTSRSRWALMHELRADPELSLEQALDRLSPCDLALVEGFKAAPIPKLEVWRAEVGKPLLHPDDPWVRGIATDNGQRLPNSPEPAVEVFALSDYDAIATFVAAEAAIYRSGN